MSSQLTKPNLFQKWLTVGLGLSAALLLGRILGLGRELVIASQYGTERTADKLILLLTFPDVMTNLLVSGAMTYVMVPEFKQLSASHQRKLFLHTTLCVGVLFVFIASVMTLIAPSLFFKFVAPGLSDNALAELEPILPLYGLIIPLTAIASVSAAWLNSKSNFIVPALGATLINSAIIIALLNFGGSSPPYQSVAVAIIIAAVIRYGLQLGFLKNELTEVNTEDRVISFSLVRRYAFALCAGGMFALFPVIARAFASYVEGGVASFNYGLKLTEVPLVIAITVLPAIVLPKIAEALHEDTLVKVQEISRSSLYATIAIALAIALPASWFAPTIVEILFGWLGLNSEAIARTAEIARIAFLALPALGAVKHNMSVMNGVKRPFIPFVISSITLIIFALLSYLLNSNFGVLGIIIAYTSSYYIAWLLFAVYGANQLGWHMRDLGLSRSIAGLFAINCGLALVIIGITTQHATSLLKDSIFGIFWCCASLALAKYSFERLRATIK